MKTLSLDGSWSLRHCDPGEGEAAGWQSTGVAGEGTLVVEVPGDVHLDLMRAGEIEEPLYGTNAEGLRWIETKDWWYSTTFDLGDDFLGDRSEICFYGLDTFADIWLNGTKLGSTRNQFVEHILDVTATVRPRRNLLVVRLDTGLRWAQQQESDKYNWQDTYYRPIERIWLRRAQFSFIWDFVQRLLTVGIWRSVEFRSHEGAALRDVYMATLAADPNRARIRMQYEVESFAGEPKEAVIDLKLEGTDGIGKCLRTTVVPGHNLITDVVMMEKPRLWYPRGLGEPYLYNVECVLQIDGQVADGRRFRFGVREIDLVQEPVGEEGEQSFAFEVNGRRIFAKGSAWVAADAILARPSPEKVRALIQDAADANHNMLHLWGGGTYESDVWWDACDELGLLVWLDFMFSVSAIPDDDPGFAAEVHQEATKVVRRLRNRASLALWCGNNENQWLSRRERPETLPYGRKTFHVTLPTVCAQLDPTRPYWPSSPWGGLDPNSEKKGDRHAWEVALSKDDYDKRVRFEDVVEARPKFVSEFGFMGPPARDSLARFLPEDQIALGTPAWQYHNNIREEDTLLMAVRRYFGVEAREVPLEDYLLYAQAFQAQALRYSIGHFRRLMPLCSGTIVWMLTEVWGTTSGWSSVDYYLNRKPAFYAIQQAYSLLLVTFIREANGLSLWLINAHHRPVVGILEYGRGDLASSEIEVIESTGVAAIGNSSNPVTRLVVPDLPEEERNRRYYWARLIPRKGKPSQDVIFLREDWAGLGLSPARVRPTAARLDGDKFRLSLTSDTFVWGLWLEHGRDVKVSDNFLTLLPGVSYELTVTGPEPRVEQVGLISLNDLLVARRAR